MKGKIELLGKEKLQLLYNNSSSYKEILELVGLCSTGGCSRKTLFKLEKEWNINKNIFLKNIETRTKKHYEKMKLIREKNKIPIKEMLVENSKYGTKYIKKKIIFNKLIKYECFICHNKGIWENEELVLQLDHINGINNDNKLENLRFLCPNCHSQTDTFASRNKESVKKRRLNKEKKILKEKEKLLLLKERKIFLDSIDTSKFGWIKIVQNEWRVSHTQVKRWIKNNYPDFVYYERNATFV